MRKLAVAFLVALVGICLFELARADDCNWQTDTDGDGIADAYDNCILTPNADQRDTDSDGFGNACDGDLDNDLMVGTSDGDLLRAALYSSAGDPNYNEDADFDADGAITVLDIVIFYPLLWAPPGPSCQPVPQSLTGSEINAVGGVVEIGDVTIQFGWLPSDASITYVDVPGPSYPTGATLIGPATSITLTGAQTVSMEWSVPPTPGIDTWALRKTAGLGHLGQDVLHWFLGRTELQFSPERRVFSATLVNGIPEVIAPVVSPYQTIAATDVIIHLPDHTTPEWAGDPPATAIAQAQTAVRTRMAQWLEDETCVTTPPVIHLVAQSYTTFLGTATTTLGHNGEPVIYLPPAFWTNLSPDQRDATLWHEAAHALQYHIDGVWLDAAVRRRPADGEPGFLDRFWTLEAYAVAEGEMTSTSNVEYLYAYDDTPGEETLGNWPAPYDGLRCKTWPSDTEIDTVYCYRLGALLRWLGEHWQESPTMCEYLTYGSLSDPLKGFDPWNFYSNQGRNIVLEKFTRYLTEINTGQGPTDIPWSYTQPSEHTLAHPGGVVSDLGHALLEGRTMRVQTNDFAQLWAAVAPRCEPPEIYIGWEKPTGTSGSFEIVLRDDIDHGDLWYLSPGDSILITPASVRGTARFDAAWVEGEPFNTAYCNGVPYYETCNAVTEGIVSLHAEGDDVPRCE